MIRGTHFYFHVHAAREQMQPQHEAEQAVAVDDAVQDHATSVWLSPELIPNESEYQPLALTPSEFADAFASRAAARAFHAQHHVHAHHHTELHTGNRYAQRGEIVDIAA